RRGGGVGARRRRGRGGGGAPAGAVAQRLQTPAAGGRRPAPPGPAPALPRLPPGGPPPGKNPRPVRTPPPDRKPRKKGRAMTEVAADQLVFASVEAEQSPTGRSGFQTLFYTHAGLDRAEVAEVEARLFHTGRADDPEKHVFFRTQRGRLALARVVPLE